MRSTNTLPAFMMERSQWIVWWYEDDTLKTPLASSAIRQLMDHRDTDGQVARPRSLRGDANARENFTSYGDACAMSDFLSKREKMKTGIGFALNGDEQVVVIDFDDVLRGGKLADAKVRKILDDLDTFVEVSVSGSGLHAYCVVSPALKRTLSEHVGAWKPLTPKGLGGEKHSVFVNGGYVTVTGKVFEKYGTLNMGCDDYFKTWAKLRFSDFGKSRPAASPSSSSADVDIDDGGIAAQVADALDAIDADCDRDTWIRVGMVLHRITSGDQRGLDLWDEWSKRAPHRYPGPREISPARLYKSFSSNELRGVSLGTLIRMANEWKGESIGRARTQLQRTIMHAKDALARLAKQRGVQVIELPKAAEHGLEIVSASDLPVEATRWLWTHVVPFGHLTLVSGGVAAGKSSWLLKLTADTTHAKPLPYDHEREEYQRMVNGALGSHNPLGKPYKRSGLVYYLTSEMHWSQTAVPTLRACEADLTKVLFMRRTVSVNKKGETQTRPFDLVNDISKLITDIVARGVIPDLIILDPITSFMGTQIDRNAESDVRTILEMMADFCASIGTAFLGVLHQNKSLDQAGVGKLLGSVAFGAVARVVLFVVRAATPDRKKEAGNWEKDSKHLAIMVEKSNIGPTNKVHVFRSQPSAELGMQVKYVTTEDIADFMRHQKEAKESGVGAVNKPAVKRDQTHAVIAQHVLGKSFPSIAAVHAAISDYVEVSKEYLRQLLDAHYVLQHHADSSITIAARKIKAANE